MSYVTDIVFVTADQADADRFAEIIHTHYDSDIQVTPLEPTHAREDSKTHVFHLVLNWAGELVAHLQLEQWRSQCLLWTKVETSEPSVDHFAAPPPPPKRRQHYSQLVDLERQAIDAGIIKPRSDQPPRPDDEEEEKEEFEPE